MTRTSTTDAVAAGRTQTLHRRAATAMSRILWASTAAALLTSVHHVYGARIYATPQRYYAVAIAVGGLALQTALLALSRARDPRRAALARRGFAAVSVLFFVVLFGTVEGGSSHIVAPLLAGGYGGEEPFDALFEVTGMLQVVPAAVVAVLAVRWLRGSRAYTDGHSHRS